VGELKQAGAFVSVTAAEDASGRIVFMDKDNNTFEFLKYSDGGVEMLGYVRDSVTYPLAGPITSLKFTGYKADGVTVTVTPGEMRNLEIEIVVADPEGQISPQTLSSRIFVRTDMVVYTQVINEIMYNPDDSLAGQEDLYYEYIELYNTTDTVVDLSGWKLRGGGVEDDILGDPVHGTGTTEVPAQGYAIITDQDTKIYDVGSPFTVSIAAVRLWVDDDNLINALHNDQDEICLVDNAGAAADYVSYSDSWGAGNSDGLGSSLERKVPAAPSNYSTNWKDSELNGSPGFAN
jgi:hypothetical protein